MKQVNAYYIHSLLNPLVGAADIDEEVERYRALDPNDENEVRSVIRACLKPYYERYDPGSKEIAKLSLAYYLSKDGSDFGRIFDSCLMPFASPEDPRHFFLWLWSELFGGEDFGLEDLSLYQVNNDIYAPNSIKLAPDV